MTDPLKKKFDEKADGRNNDIRNIRPDATFDNFEPATETQSKIRDTCEGLAQSLIDAAPGYANGNNPLKNGAFFVLSSAPGRGKTHLLEAMVNKIGEEAPDLLDSTFLLRDDFTLHTISGGASPLTFNHKSIILIDDLFSKYHSLDDLHAATDLKNFMDLIASAYENRWFVMVTSNFPIVEGLLPRIAEIDKVGRITSRCKEILTARAGEFILDGDDYREVLMQKALAEREKSGDNVPKLEF
jgi:DNA replication protein DnaC